MIEETLVRLAGQLADAAGDVIRRHFRQPFEIEAKADASPVTIADREAETAIRQILEERRPLDGVIGEEHGADRADARFVWVLDPIDGTKSFMAGRPIFGTLIALLDSGHPVLGVIDQPLLGERWVGAAGRPTTLNSKAVTTRRCPTLAQARLASTDPVMFVGEDRKRFARVQDGVATTLWGGDCYGFASVAAGWLDLVVECDHKLHDFAALAPVVEGAGGRMTDWRGAPLTIESDGRVVAAGDPALHDQVIDLLR